MSTDEFYMAKALQLAQQAGAAGEVPVGALVVRNGEIIGEGYNQPISACDPTAHAEVVAMRNAASKINNYRLSDCDLYVTIEPCTMCVGAMIHARIETVVFGAREPKAGALVSNLQLHEKPLYNHKLNVLEGILSDDCSELIVSFFQSKRS